MTYILSYISAIYFSGREVAQGISITAGTFIYIIVMQLMGMPSRFVSTIFCYVAGVWICIYK